jgi:hypothetical protein
MAGLKDVVNLRHFSQEIKLMKAAIGVHILDI